MLFPHTVPLSIMKCKAPYPHTTLKFLTLDNHSNFLGTQPAASREELGTHLLPRQLQPFILLLAVCRAIGTSKPEKVIALKVTELFPQLTYERKQKSHTSWVYLRQRQPKGSVNRSDFQVFHGGFFSFCSQPRTAAEREKVFLLLMSGTRPS